MKAYDLLGHSTPEGSVLCINCLFPGEHEEEFQPIFASSEFDTPVFCDNCGEYIDCTLTSDAIKYVIECIIRNIQSNVPVNEDFRMIADEHYISLSDLIERHNTDASSRNLATNRANHKP